MSGRLAPLLIEKFANRYALGHYPRRGTVSPPRLIWADKRTIPRSNAPAKVTTRAPSCMATSRLRCQRSQSKPLRSPYLGRWPRRYPLAASTTDPEPRC